MSERAGIAGSSALRALTRPRDVARALHAFVWMLVARALLLAGGFKLARRALRYEVVSEVDRPYGDAPTIAPGAGRALYLASRVLDIEALHVSCIPRSIALERVCAANKVAAELVIGVDRSNGFRAHAWVELNGYPLGVNEVGRAHWTALARFRARASRTTA